MLGIELRVSGGAEPLVGVSIAVINTMTITGGGKGLLQVAALRSHSIAEGSQDRNLEAREKYWLLTFSSWLA